MLESSDEQLVVKTWDEPWNLEVPDVLLIPDGTVYRRRNLEDYVRQVEAQGVRVQ